jgi:hypothetical protein
LQLNPSRKDTLSLLLRDHRDEGWSIFKKRFPIKTIFFGAEEYFLPFEFKISFRKGFTKTMHGDGEGQNVVYTASRRKPQRDASIKLLRFSASGSRTPTASGGLSN